MMRLAAARTKIPITSTVPRSSVFTFVNNLKDVHHINKQFTQGDVVRNVFSIIYSVSLFKCGVHAREFRIKGSLLVFMYCCHKKSQFPLSFVAAQ